MPGRSGERAYNNVYFIPGQTSPEDALSSSGNYPASGSYINVGDCSWVEVFIHMGAIDGSDTPGFSLKCTDAADGTLDSISATAMHHVCAANDDDECVLFELDPKALPDEHFYVAITTSAVANGSYGDIMFRLYKNSVPVTQSTSVLPSASAHVYTG